MSSLFPVYFVLFLNGLVSFYQPPKTNRTCQKHYNQAGNRKPLAGNKYFQATENATNPKRSRIHCPHSSVCTVIGRNVGNRSRVYCGACPKMHWLFQSCGTKAYGKKKQSAAPTAYYHDNWTSHIHPSRARSISSALFSVVSVILEPPMIRASSFLRPSSASGVTVV